MFVENRIKSMPRNKLILNTLYKSKDVEIFGSGFKKVYFYCSKMDRKVSYNSENGGFSFVFFRDIDADINSDISSDKEKTDVTKKM